MLSLPEGLSFGDAAASAAALGRLNAVELRFDPGDRYNFWSGIIGGFFLPLSYFGTDQSQVERYLTGRSVTESRLGLLFNGMLKIPMQFVILSLGVLVFVFYLFVTPPLFFQPEARARMAGGPAAPAWGALESRYETEARDRAASLEGWLAARRNGTDEAKEAARARLLADQARLTATRGEAVALIKQHAPESPTNDTNYVFLSFVLAHLPAGLVGLVFAAIFAASMNSTSAELNALTSTTVVDVIGRMRGHREGRTHAGDAAARAGGLGGPRLVTVAWAGFAVLFAEYASRLGSLIEAVNILGSLVYGTILGIFLTAFYAPRVGGRAVFWAALVAEAAIVACFAFTKIAFLWYNLIGCALVVGISLLLSLWWPRTQRPPADRSPGGRVTA